MTSNILALLDRKIGRIEDGHISRLLEILNESLKLIDVSRKSTIRDSLDHFTQATMKALQQYTVDMRNEVLSFVEQIQMALTEDSKSSLLDVASKHFDDSLYLNRFRIYEGAISRHMRRFGSSIDLSAFRHDLVKASHHVATINFIRVFLASLADELETLALRHDQAILTTNTQQESRLAQMNRFIKLEPNFFGLGLNFNYLIRKLFAKKD